MAVTALGAMVVAHSIKVGGYELDEAIVRSLQAFQKLLIGQEQAEALKLEIGRAIPAPGPAEPATVAGRDLVTGMLRRVAIDADQVQSALERPLARIVAAVKDLLEQAPAELSSDIAERGLMLVGGGALLPGFDELLRRETNLAVTVAEEPLTAVARGAGAALEELATLTQITNTKRQRFRARR
jgi:rod shape-determining protein MreB and related proteins